MQTDIRETCAMMKRLLDEISEEMHHATITESWDQNKARRHDIKLRRAYDRAETLKGLNNHLLNNLQGVISLKY